MRARFEQHLEELEDLAAREVERHLLQPELRAVAEFYVDRLAECRATWEAVGGNVPAGFGTHAKAGNLELLTCAATHAVLPLLRPSPAALRAQVRLGLTEHVRQFGNLPAGFWLPECAYTPELDPILIAAGVRWTVVETHGLMHAVPTPQGAVFAPVLTPAGLAVFGRDPASARQVWSRHEGYPGDPRYREFHRDLAQDAERGYLTPHRSPVAQPTFTGLKYHAVTGTAETKRVYRRAEALDAVRAHAAHFVAERVAWAGRAVADGPLPEGRPPLCLAPYDAELFGHWWYEGPEFLDEVMRLTVGANANTPLELVTPAEHLARFPRCEQLQPAVSTWGEGGHLAVWLDVRNAWMQTPLRTAEARLATLGHHQIHGPSARLDLSADPARALCQAARELLLAQASDWPFLIHHQTAGDYPRRRFTEHLSAFHQLASMLEGLQPWDPAWLAEREAQHPLFPELDWRWWAGAT